MFRYVFSQTSIRASIDSLSTDKGGDNHDH